MTIAEIIALARLSCDGSGGSGSGGATTLHISVTAINLETRETTFTADKTPAEMMQASLNGPIWCVVTFGAGLVGEEEVSFGVPPVWLSGAVAFGAAIAIAHEDNGNNNIFYAVQGALSNSWILDLNAFLS